MPASSTSIIRTCPTCGRKFHTSRYPYRSYCSTKCRDEKSGERARVEMRTRRNPNPKPSHPCQVCGYNEVVDKHHEGNDFYYLCPNHHALITRGIKRIEEYNIQPVGLERGQAHPEVYNEMLCEHGILRHECIICGKEV